jgi:hypothetical protein
VVTREVLAMCMESPLYFTMPLPERLKFLKEVEQKTWGAEVREGLLVWVKTGRFRPADGDFYSGLR